MAERRKGNLSGNRDYDRDREYYREQGEPEYYDRQDYKDDRNGQSYYEAQGNPRSYQEREYRGSTGDRGYSRSRQDGRYSSQGERRYQDGPGRSQGRPDPRYYQDPRSRRDYDEPRGKKKKKKKRRKLLFVLELLILLVLALGLFAVAQLNRMGRVNLKDIIINSGIGQSGYRNIALFGVDSREGELESGTNSDTIMICSINKKTGAIKLVSVYRDTYLDVNDGSFNKANSAYAGGGAERAVNMLNKNLDLDITDFATVDFSAVIKAVDLLGGIDIELTDEEVQWLNAYLVETSQVTGVSYENVTSSGMQHLSGIQAMAYCRIRYTEGWDYKRTERQRLVLEQILAQAQQQGVTTLVSLVNTMLPYINTSLSNTEIISLASNVGKYSIESTEGFPYDKIAANVDAGDCVVPVTLASNVSQLHQYLFNLDSYTPSETVQSISNQIINNTGIQ